MTEIAQANHIRVIIASLTPAADYPWRKGMEPVPKIRDLNAWLKEFCKQHKATYLDYWSAMVDENGGMKPGISFDGVHPNAEGYAIMGPLAEAAIKKKK
jgi:lysophospholipase L1-like esterase